MRPPCDEGSNPSTSTNQPNQKGQTMIYNYRPESRPPLRMATTSSTADEIERYLPSNFEAVDLPEGSKATALIYGNDRDGWTLEDYVIPRLASGLHTAEVLL